MQKSGASARPVADQGPHIDPVQAAVKKPAEAFAIPRDMGYKEGNAITKYYNDTHIDR